MVEHQIRILLVEDERSHAAFMRRTLANHTTPTQVEVVHTLAEANDRLATTRPDLVIVDLQLPDGSGIELLTADGHAEATPFLVMTSHGDEQAAVEAMKAGAVDYVVKTSDNLANLGRIVDRTLDTWRLHAEHERVLKRLSLLSSAIEQSSEGLAVVDLDGKVIFSNDAFAQSHGYTPDELLGRHLSVFHTPQQMPAVEAAQQQILQTGFFGGEIWHVRRNGETFPALMQNSLLRDDNGDPIGIIGTLREITDLKQTEKELRQARDELELRVQRRTTELTAANASLTKEVAERKQAEKALQKSEGMLRSLFENLPDFVIVVDREANIRFANHPSSWGDPEQMQGTSGLGHVAPECRQACEEALARGFASGEVQYLRVRAIDDSWWDCRLVPLRDNGAIDRVMVICEDITSRIAAEEAVAQEQQLLRRLLNLHERERRLTAYEIHDGFAQYLTGALYQFQAARQHVEQLPQAAREDFDQGLRSLSNSIDEARRLINGLRPPILDEAGIVAALEHLMFDIERTGDLRIEFIHDVGERRLAPPLESTVFRIVQEALSNARRHSGSKKIRIDLAVDVDQVRIRVEDWGVGFDPDKVKHKHFGLRGIRERARLFGGWTRIESKLGQGTLIQAELPLLEQLPEDSDSGSSDPDLEVQ